ncbi:MAG: hypothetical protein WBN02_02955 [Sedimenticolaceae bacterium]
MPEIGPDAGGAAMCFLFAEEARMGDVTRLPDNFIGKEDRERLESFGGHTIARGRATRWHWGTDAAGNDAFEIYEGGTDERLAASVSRDRRLSVFLAVNGERHAIGSGDLEHLMAELEQYFVKKHGELPDTPA